ncbi:hypothetical protein [Brachybacterium phenoliresistens]|uniref:hypothetical protein n=1 Tax=Brachybacterium phenoliresistens TaxID=396014 RepID=UPI0031D2C4B5
MASLRIIVRPLALLGVGALLLAGCVPPLPFLPRGGPDLREDDTIAVHLPISGMFGYFGDRTDTIGADTFTTQVSLPEGLVIFEESAPLAEAQRARIETAAEDYLAWEATLSEQEHVPCTDIPTVGIRVTGSMEHGSRVQDCHGDSPLRALTTSVADAREELIGEIALPTDDWILEVAPVPGGPDPEAGGSYRLTLAASRKGMDLLGPDGAVRSLDWEGSAPVLRGINDVLIHEDEIGCSDAAAELTMTRSGDPSLSRTVPICPGQPPEALAEALAGA